MSNEKPLDAFGLQQNNCYLTDAQQIAQAFNIHFSTNGKKLARAFGKGV